MQKMGNVWAMREEEKRTGKQYEIVNSIKIPYGHILFEPRQYHDKAVVGFDGVVLYNYDLFLDTLMEMGMSYSESVEWVDYNTIPAGYGVCGWPVFVDDTMKRLKWYEEDSSEEDRSEYSDEE